MAQCLIRVKKLAAAPAFAKWEGEMMVGGPAAPLRFGKQPFRHNDTVLEMFKKVQFHAINLKG